MVAAVAFLFAAQGHIDIASFAAMIIGVSLIIGGACVFNNYIDRGIDKHMERTRKRALASGQMKPQSALIYGFVLEIFGFLALVLFTNVYALVAACVGLIMYVWTYGYFKRRSLHGTEVGSIAGAMPPVVGYSAASGSINGAAVLLFAALVCWQMPHFYSIAVYRLKDYSKVKLPMLPVVKGIPAARIQILVYIIAFGAVCLLLTLLGYSSVTLSVVMLGLSGYWFWLGVSSYTPASSHDWARRMFKFSLNVLLIFSLLLSLDWLLP